MNGSEKEDALRVGRVIRAARKMRGVCQAEISGQLQITQATLSNIETGQVAVSGSLWFRLARILGISSEYTFLEGIIDNFESPSDPENTHLKIPKRYLRHPFSTVRTSQPFFQFFSTCFGPGAIENFLRYQLKVDPDIQCIYSLKLSVHFNLDLASHLIQTGRLTMSNLRELTCVLKSPRAHGKLAQAYDRLSNRRELIKLFVRNSPLYEKNFTYTIESESRNLIDIRSTPVDFMRYFSYKEDQLPDFLNLYRASSLESFSQYLGDREPIPVKIIPSETKRKTECIFRLTI